MTELEYRPRPFGPPRVGGRPRRQQLGRAGTHTETQDGRTRSWPRARRRRQLHRYRGHLRPRVRLCETFLGEALRGRRDEVVIATKFGHASLLLAAARLGRAAPAGTSAPPWRARCGASRPTGSTSTSCTRPTPRRRSTRRSRRSTTSCARARSATSAIRTSAAGRSPRRVRRPRARRDLVRLRAERVQPALTRAEAEVLPAVRHSVSASSLSSRCRTAC